MKKIYFIASIGFLFLSATVSAQKMNTDSMTLVSKISEDQLKLGKLQNTVDQKTRDKQDAATKAQQSADANKTAAERLADNSQDKKIARQADNAASDARSDAKRARVASDKLDDLNKEISKIQEKIASNQNKLNKYIPVTVPVVVAAQPLVAPAPTAIPDTTQHQ